MTTEHLHEFRVLLEQTRGDMQAQQMALALRRHNQTRLQRIEAAPGRTDKGEYGICARCEEEIARARLRVRPEAPLRVKCASGQG